MGKNGEAMRAAKAQQLRTFTNQQLADRDRALLIDCRKRMKKEMDEYLASEKMRIWKMIEEEWQRRTEVLRAQDGTDGFMTLLTLLQSISCRVLIEHFGWPAVNKRVSSRSRTVRFCNLLVEEINKIVKSEKMDIRMYNDEVEKKYGIRFITLDPEEKS